ncbi:acyl-CoA dehydrogenase family protein [Leisingera thetidis]|uniref:acyl-CoA dehydrogenase family protein n=1 Tax=Leisingera thetidis TaxID=2930199 RepID=UPI0021F72D77|nr:acyl-CoA dehydrogenase family protein [Leisingera thetidis]
MSVETHPQLLARVREEFAALHVPGRAIGQAISEDPDATRTLSGLPCITRISRLGLAADDSMAERVAIYETLGHADPNLAAAVPGPVMTGFVLHALADRSQLSACQDLFAAAPSWSCFALTERNCGTDATALETTAVAVDGGWKLDGHKYMVGQGVVADYIVVFARTGPGPLGVEAFGFCPTAQPGFSASRLPLTGLAGTNLSQISLQGVLLPDSARLGAHLKPSERARRSVSATLDAMRPCLGAVALGHGRAVLERAEAEQLVSREWAAPYKLRLAALLNWALRIAAARDAGTVLAREAGLMKQSATAAAEALVSALWARLTPEALVSRPWLRRAWRDAGAFEYMEGLSAIHRVNAAGEFRASGRPAGV